MPEIGRTAQAVIAGMTPQVRAGRFVFVILPDPAMASPLVADALAMFREDEGVSLILPSELAQAIGAPTDQPMRQPVRLPIGAPARGHRPHAKEVLCKRPGHPSVFDRFRPSAAAEHNGRSRDVRSVSSPGLS